MTASVDSQEYQITHAVLHIQPMTLNLYPYPQRHITLNSIAAALQSVFGCQLTLGVNQVGR